MLSPTKHPPLAALTLLPSALAQGRAIRLRSQCEPHQKPANDAIAVTINEIPLTMPITPADCGRSAAVLLILPHTVNGIAQPIQTENASVSKNVNKTSMTSGSGLAAGAFVVAAATGVPHFQHATAWSGRVVWQFLRVRCVESIFLRYNQSQGA